MIDDNSKEFIRRHIGPSEEDQAKMLAAVGYKSLNDLLSIVSKMLKGKMTVSR